jgi:myo-inositol-1(or 4)-monophosphatase
VPEFVVAIALVERGVSMLGLIYNPIKDELFWGGHRLGCHHDGGSVRATDTTRLADAMVLASHNETAGAEWKAYEGRVKADGSVAYKLALVAAGQSDATFTRKPLSEWNVAAGAALIIGAGGRITDAEGCELCFNRSVVTIKGVIASNGRLHDRLESLVPLGNPER